MNLSPKLVYLLFSANSGLKINPKLVYFLAPNGLKIKPKVVKTKRRWFKNNNQIGLLSCANGLGINNTNICLLFKQMYIGGRLPFLTKNNSFFCSKLAFIKYLEHVSKRIFSYPKYFRVNITSKTRINTISFSKVKL